MKAVLLDIDGTVLDTTEFIFQEFEHTFKHFGLPVPSRKELAAQVGKALQECYAHFNTGIDSAALCEEHRAFQVKNLHLSKPYTNTVGTLKKLKELGYKIAAVTARAGITAGTTLVLAGIDKFFDAIITGNDVKNLKPHPEAFLRALELLGVDKSEAVIVGDTDSDILAGKSAGITTIGVTYGFHGEKIHDSKPDFTVDDIAAILKVIK